VVKPRAQNIDRTASVQPNTRPSTYPSPSLNQPNVSMSPPPSHRASGSTKTLTTQADRPNGTDKLDGRVSSESRYHLDDDKGKGAPDEDGQKNASETRTTLPQAQGRAAPSSVHSSPQVDRTASVQPTTSSTYPSSPLNRSNVPISPPPPHAAPALTKTPTTQAGRLNDTDKLNEGPGVVSSESRYRPDDGRGKGTPDEDSRKDSNVPETQTTLPPTPGRTALSSVRPSPQVDHTTSVQPTAHSSTYPSLPLNPLSVSMSPPPIHAPPAITKTLTIQAGGPKGTDELNGQPGVVSSDLRYRRNDGKGKGTANEDGQKNASETRTTLSQIPGRAAPSLVPSSPPQPLAVSERPHLDRSHSHMQQGHV